MKHSLLPLFFLLAIIACGDNSSSNNTKCAYGQPLAIFDESLPQVVTHQFSAQGQNASELLQFDSGLSLEVLQGGCDHIKQEFRFRIPGKAPENSEAFWIAQAIAHFHFLGQLSERHQQYHQYAKAIENIGAEMKLAQTRSLGDGFSIRIDRISGVDYNLLQVEVGEGEF